MLVVMTGDKGLVGGLWHEIMNASLENIEQYQSVVLLGAKGKNYAKEENLPVIKLFINAFDILKQEELHSITGYIFQEFKKGTFSKVDILYPKFVSLAEQTAKFISFLPFEFKPTTAGNSSEGLPIFEPSKSAVFAGLLEKHIGAFFYKIVMETKLSELSARTVAMEHATAKSKELATKLEINYTKERRRILTQRQLLSFVAHRTI